MLEIIWKVFLCVLNHNTVAKHDTVWTAFIWDFNHAKSLSYVFWFPPTTFHKSLVQQDAPFSNSSYRHPKTTDQIGEEQGSAGSKKMHRTRQSSHLFLICHYRCPSWVLGTVPVNKTQRFNAAHTQTISAPLFRAVMLNQNAATTRGA